MDLPCLGGRNLYLPDDLWERAQQAARQESVRRERDVSVSEWVREAMEQRLEAER